MNPFTSLLKAIVNVAATPVAIAADIITMGGAMTDAKQPYTATQLQNLMQNLEDAGKPKESE
jgi:hypothetical protein